MSKTWGFFLVAKDMILSHRAKFQFIINFFRVKAISTGLSATSYISSSYARKMVATCMQLYAARSSVRKPQASNNVKLIVILLSQQGENISYSAETQSCKRSDK